MTTASGEGERTRRLIKPVVAYAIVLALLGWVGIFLWTSGRDGPSSAAGLAAPSRPALAEPLHAVQGANHPRPASPEASASTKKETPPAHAVLPPASPSEVSNNDAAASTGPTKNDPAREPALSSASSQSEKSTDQALSKPSEPPKTTCTVDVGRWPVDSTEQVKAIQILMRDLGFYSGTTYGTLGPTTRAAIRKFQLAADQAETGEPSEMLFESLKKKCP